MVPPPFTVPWDDRSDQPHRVLDRDLRRAARAGAWGEWAITAATALAAAPVVALRALALPRLPAPPLRDLAGVAVSAGRHPAPALSDLLDDLGVRRVLIRLRLGHDERAGLDLAQALAPRPLCLVLAQERRHVCDPAAWRTEVAAVLRDLPAHVEAVQFGTAVNRLKWGCAHSGDALRLTEAVCDLPLPAGVRRLVAPVIDFDPLSHLRLLLNRRRFQAEACASLLYVDRRGDPANRQWGLDLTGKIRLLAALASLSPRLDPAQRGRLWITEFNWPLAGHGGWAPTSPNECVSEADAARFLAAYLRSAAASGRVERAYWWQLVARGYGLVDDSEGRLRPRPAFAAMRELLAAGVNQAGAGTV